MRHARSSLCCCSILGVTLSEHAVGRPRARRKREWFARKILNNSAKSFGPFELRPAERLLQKTGVPVHLSDRALDILLVLVARAGEAVGKRELMKLVWPDVTVDEASLRFHISALRKVLGEGPSGPRYITTLSGRGYCFVSPVSMPGGAKGPAVASAVFVQPHRLPVPPARMVGRDAAVKEIAAQLLADRFVTIVGPGGVGKTAVVVAASHLLLANFEGATCFYDLGMLNDPDLLPSAIAAALGLVVQSGDPVVDLLSFLRERRMLLILDGCEHVVETVAALAERIVQQAPRVHLLTTSREALRVEGEHVFQLPPLESPPDDSELSAAELLEFPAPRLFADRIGASGWRFELDEADLKIVADMCRRLDGLPLAIELAAGRVNVFGIRETAALLNDRLRLLWEGRRTAVPRHQTLRATLDWSHSLLTERERVVLRRLSIFVGFFTQEAARSVAAADEVGSDEVALVIESLVAKSLLSADPMGRLRLLDSTRAYAQEKLLESNEAEQIARNHAAYFLEALQRGGPVSDVSPEAAGLVALRPYIGNIRTALEWSFSDRRDLTIGTALAVAAAPLFLDMSFLSECSRWTGDAIDALDDASRGTLREMELQASLGLSLMFAGSDGNQARVAFARGLEIAEQRGDMPNQLKMLGRLHLFDYRAGHFRSALQLARRSETVARDIADPVGIAFAHSLMGLSLHHDEDPVAARIHLEAALKLDQASRKIDAFNFGLDFRNRAGTCLARTLWLLGYPDQATRIAKFTVQDAASADHPITLCIALIWAASVFLWNCDWASAEESIDRLIALAVGRSLIQYSAAGFGLKGYLQVKRGAAKDGIDLLTASIADMQRHRYGLLMAPFNSTLAEGLLMTGRREPALAKIEQTIALVERDGDVSNLPELLRIKAVMLASRPRADAEQAEAYFRRSLELAARHSVLGWELRTAATFGEFLIGQARFEEAREFLAPVVARFTEGFESRDFKSAQNTLAKIADLRPS
jgi:predicted ATPase/DNA-binding winged helix-turn-helix (wHTH) protein